jgi:hypothetical protein
LNLKPPTAPVAHKNGAATIQSTFVQGFCQRRKCQSEGGKRLSSGGQSMSLQSWPWWIEQIHSKKGLPMTSPKALMILIAKNDKLLLLFAVHLI